MRVTVCELPHDPAARLAAWDGLVEHCRSQDSELVVLPEMPFSEWLAATKDVDPQRWEQSVNDHLEWIERLDEFEAPTVISARPVTAGGVRHNEGFVWQRGELVASHHKYYLPDEDGFWEATWYDRGVAPDYPVITSGHVDVGLLLCTEMWFTEHARDLGRRGISVLATPRATERATRDRWLVGGRTAAIMAGAYGLSSNHSGVDTVGMEWGGQGWVVSPSGDVLAITSEDTPFATVAIDLDQAEHAKKTYPRYVAE